MTKILPAVVLLMAELGPPALADDRPQDVRKPVEAASGPTLQGRVVDEAGRPLAGARLILYAGVVTRWKIAEGETDADGRYHVDDVRSSMIKDQKKDRWEYNVMVRVEHPTHVEADGRSSREIRFSADPKHVETLDLRLTPGGHIEGMIKDSKTGHPLKKLDLRIMTPKHSHGHGSTFHAYAATDDEGRFRSISLYPGEYDVEANSSTLDYPVLGQAMVEAGKTTASSFAVTLPRVISGRVVDGEGEPLDGVDVTLLAAEHSGMTIDGEEDYSKARSRAWTIYRPSQHDRFELAFLPGLEDARYVLAFHKKLGLAKASVESLERGEPIRLTPWKR